MCVCEGGPERHTCLGGEVAARLELLEEGGHEDGGEEEDHAPEEDVWDVGAVGAAGAAHKLPVQRLALLLAPEDTVMMMRMMRMTDVGGELVSENKLVPSLLYVLNMCAVASQTIRPPRRDGVTPWWTYRRRLPPVMCVRLFKLNLHAHSARLNPAHTS